MKNKLKLIVNNTNQNKEIFFIKKELQCILNLYARKVSSGDWKDYGLSINKKEISFDLKRGKDIFGDNTFLKRLGVKKFKSVSQSLLSYKK